MLAVSGAGEGHHPCGHAQDGVVLTNLVCTVAGEGRHHPSDHVQDSVVGLKVVVNVETGGEGHEFHGHADHGAGAEDGEQEHLATVGDGFKTEFRKITRARRMIR